MNKRVLRDRSTLRPPSDEPPIKKVPPKTVRGPFPFEDLPPEFHNRVLEKMDDDDFMKFQCGNQFSARICEEFENRDGPFPLEELPEVLYLNLVEKLPFKDLTVFNQGSKLAVKMCEQLKVVEAPVRKVYIVGRVESFKTRRKKARLNLVPKNVRLHTEILEIDQNNLTTIEKYKISADKVQFYGEAGVDADFVREVLNLTRPKEVCFDTTSLPALTLEELKKVNEVTFDPWENFDDSDLLAIKLKSFTIGFRNAPKEVTSNGIVRLLQEWKEGLREIENILMPFYGLDEKLIVREFPGHPQNPSQRMVLCKEDGVDCIVDTVGGNKLKIYERECEGEGKRYHLSRRKICSSHWADIRRSPPL